jgi:hypothetical protein
VRTGHCLRGQHNIRDVYCADLNGNGGLFGRHRAAQAIVNASLPYAAQLIVLSVPKGSAWSMDLSDVPVIRVSEPVGARGVAYGSDKRTAFERAMRARQLAQARPA